MLNREQRKISEAEGRRLMKLGWSEFEEITHEARTIQILAEMAMPPVRVFKNNLYVVQIWQAIPTEFGWLEKVGIRRNDGSEVRAWDEVQRVKNAIFSPERVALEIYPEQSRLTDVANMRWIWALADGRRSPVSLGR